MLTEFEHKLFLIHIKVTFPISGLTTKSVLAPLTPCHTWLSQSKK